MLHEAVRGLPLDEAAIQDFQAGLRGQVILPGDADYDAVRNVWNGMIDRQPALITRCAGVADVSRAIGFARDQHLPLAVRGGGHNVTGAGTCDGGLVMDLSPMKAVQVDAERRIARVEPGTTWKEFDEEAQKYGLATTGGLVSSTGVSGFTLGGGIGWLVRKHGLACDNLLAAEVVTAEGQLVRASADEHPDLWPVRRLATPRAWGLHQLPGRRRRGSGALGLRPQLRAPGWVEEHVRPQQPVPAQPEHSTSFPGKEQQDTMKEETIQWVPIHTSLRRHGKCMPAIFSERRNRSGCSGSCHGTVGV